MKSHQLGMPPVDGIFALRLCDPPDLFSLEGVLSQAIRDNIRYYCFKQNLGSSAVGYSVSLRGGAQR